MSNIRKSIAYCYPTSPNAETLGQPGFYIQQYRKLETGEWSVGYIEQGHDVFESVSDRDLHTLLDEADGVYYPSWCYMARYYK